jgi:Spy/CpxP family protein refolding chaperone
MKTLSPLLLCLCAALMVSPTSAVADDSTPPSQTAPSDGTNTGTDASQRRQRFQEIIAQLNLMDEQKQQIRHIRQTVTDQTQRRQQIMAVLTPEQRQKLRQFFQQNRSNGGTTGEAADGSDLAPGAN